MSSEELKVRPDSLDRRRRWRRRVVVAGILGLVGGAVFAWAGVQWMARRTLEQAVAEADRLDPGWRLADLAASRRLVPAGANSAGRVLEAAKGIPDRWPDVFESQSSSTAPKPGETHEAVVEPTTAAVEPLLGGAEIEEAVRKTAPNVTLSPEIRRAVDLVLKPVDGAVAPARALAGASEGRFEFSFGEVAIAPDRPHIEAARRVSRLLYLDAVRQAEAGKIDEALISARGIIGVGRSLGDEPVDLSQLFRLHQRRSAVSAIVRALSQGNASDASLVAVQKDLAGEVAHDALLCAMRAQRAAYFDTLGKMTEGAYTRYAEGDFGRADDPRAQNGSARPAPIVQALYMRAYGCYNQALALSILSQAVEGAKHRPFEKRWSEHWGVYEARLDEGGPIQRRLGATAYTVLPLNTSFAWINYETEARFAAMRVLLAAERYRLANGRWPDTLADVVPAYLQEVPRGPYSDVPVRFIRKHGGVVAYAVGFGGEDNGGRLHPERKREPKYDIGEELWNPEFRRLAPPVASPKSEATGSRDAGP